MNQLLMLLDYAISLVVHPFFQIRLELNIFEVYWLFTYHLEAEKVLFCELFLKFDDMYRTFRIMYIEGWFVSC